MARDFTSGSTQYLANTSSSPITAAPFTISAWINSDSEAADGTVVAFVDQSSTVIYWELKINTTASSATEVQLIARNTSLGTASTSTNWSLNTWHHVCCVESAANDRAVFLDGGSKGTDTTSITPTGIDLVSVGSTQDGSPHNYFNGRIAEIGVWDVALGDDEVKGLSAGVSPAHVRSESLVSYWPLFGLSSTSNEVDYSKNNLTLTQSNSPPPGDHAPVAPMFGYDTWVDLTVFFQKNAPSVSVGSGGPRTILLP